jgi:N-acetylmuramoyl-L-alanine amidase
MRSLLFILFCNCAFAQSISDCKKRFDTYLNFRGQLTGMVEFKSDAIFFLNKKGQKEFAVYTQEIGMIAELFENTTPLEQLAFIKKKGLVPYTKRQRDSIWIQMDDDKKPPKRKRAKPLQGYRIAIDAGHFAANITEAKLEQKYLAIVKDSVLHPQDTSFLFEAELNFITAQLVKKKLEEAGATVFNPRKDKGLTALGCSYNDWYKLKRERSLDSLAHLKELSEERALQLKQLSPYKLFWGFFRDYELAQRAKYINKQKPHLTLVIHYNVDEANNPWTKLTTNNTTMCFIGGAFTADNLGKTESYLHFIRLLLSNQLNESEKLSALTVQQFTTQLKIPKAIANQIDYLNNNCLKTSSEGVFSRNLLLCRLVNSPLVYGEALYQDNVQEFERLQMKTELMGAEKISLRLQEVANCYVEAVMNYCKKN